jgi:hypothetical protein
MALGTRLACAVGFFAIVGMPFTAGAVPFTEEIDITDRTTNPPTVIPRTSILEPAAGNEPSFTYTTIASVPNFPGIINKSIFLIEAPAGTGCPEPAGEACAPGSTSDIIQLVVTPDPAAFASSFFTITIFSEPNPALGNPLPFDTTIVETGDFIPLTRALFPEAVAGGEPLNVSLKSCSSPCDVPEPGTLALLGSGLFFLLVMRRRSIH